MEINGIHKSFKKKAKIDLFSLDGKKQFNLKELKENTEYEAIFNMNCNSGLIFIQIHFLILIDTFIKVTFDEPVYEKS